jgi:hypothetical protein
MKNAAKKINEKSDEDDSYLKISIMIINFIYCHAVEYSI